MSVKPRHIAILLSIALSVELSAQSQWEEVLPKIKPSADFSIWTSANYNLSWMHYNAGGVNPINLMSNSRLSQTIGIDYASYTLQYTFRLPFNTLDKNSPLSNYYLLSTGYGADNWEIDGYVGRVQGWFDMTSFRDEKIEEDRMDPRYREDARTFMMGLTSFYFLSEKYRYSHAMKYAYLQDKSGFTFYSSLKQKYHRLRLDSAFYLPSVTTIETPMNAMERMFVFETSMTVGFTGVLTNSNWFLRGLLGFGPGIQIQTYRRNERSSVRPFISPAFDAKMSFGYKTNGLYLALNVPVDALLVYLPKETFYLRANQSFNFVVGFQMHDLIREANKRNLNDELGSL